MKVASNRITDIRKYYTNQLADNMLFEESRFLVDSVISHFANISRLELPLYLDHRVNESLLLKIHFAIKDLLQNKPLQYVLGETEFCGYKFYVDNSVLIPRPETEELVSLIYTEKKGLNEPLRILDLGTGSGCIAISLAKKLVSKVFSVDNSEAALAIAIQNGKNHQLDIAFIHQDILAKQAIEALPDNLDLIVSNPPYVREQEKKMMHQNVLDFEPEKALFVEDNNALVFYEAISKLATKLLKIDGILWFEINEYLGKETKSLVLKYFRKVELINDYKGKPRFIRASSII